MKKQSDYFIKMKDYVDNQIGWVRILKQREREDMIRDSDKTSDIFKNQIQAISERMDRRDEAVNKQMEAISKIVYMGIGIAIVVNVLIGVVMALIVIFVKK
jgi:hypothetical protein